MSNLLGEVAKLKELELARAPDCDRTIFAYLGALQKAAPKLLDILSMVRASDVEYIELAMAYLINGLCIDGDDKMIECLCRYRDMAAKMEAER